MLERDRVWKALAGLIFGAVLAAGWGMAAPAPAYEAVAVPNGGVLTGSVRFSGTIPKLEPIPVKKNQDTCGHSVPNEALVLGPTRGVKGSVILIEGVPKGKKAEGEMVLDNVRCLFVPHVSAVMAGAPAKIRNSDPLQHNAHGFLAVRPIFNLPLSFKGRVSDVTARLREPGLVKVLCDVHTHMFAWIVVHDNPYVAVTDDAGRFRIDGIPPGSYTVTMWHEGFVQKGVDKDGRPVYDELRVAKNVSIPPGGTTMVEFELR